MSPAQWLSALRVGHARRLLEGTRLGVEQVAQACGFADAEALRRHFKAQTGLTPARYRERFSPGFEG